MRIDAHQHYWKLDRNDYGWLMPDDKVLYRDYLPEDLSGLLERNGIKRSIVVQAAQTHEETDFLLELADRNDSIAGVVGWLDLHNRDYRRILERFLGHPKFVGIRIMIQEMANPNEVLQPDALEAIRYMESTDLPVDLLCRSSQLDTVVELLNKVPNLRGVIDHIAKPLIAERQFEPWKTQMAALASNPGIYCKLSGMVTEADHANWKQEDIEPYILQALELFGPKRVMFGSDWPVCLLAAGYDEVVDVLLKAVSDRMGEQEMEDLFGRSAAAFYKLKG